MSSVDMETIVSLCKRRGFIFQSSEIYGGAGGCWDYGPLGVELKRNVKEAWWKAMVHDRDDVVGIDASILMNPQVWVASGHVQQFSDPMVDCKECKGECPSGVDMAKLKYEFLAQYFGARGYPLRSRLFGRVDLLFRLGSAFAPVSNWIGGSRLLWLAMDRFLGIDRRRRLPRFSRRRFSRWFRARPPRPAGAHGTVVLFGDTYSEYSEPEVAIAATRILESAGFRVEMAAGTVCCGRPLISKGLLRQAQAHFRSDQVTFQILPWC